MKTKGFTLLEIMIVVAIVGLLATIGIPAFVKVRLESRKNACLNGQRMVRDALEQWSLSHEVALGMEIPDDGKVEIISYIKGNALPKCPEGDITIQVPDTFGTPVMCPVEASRDIHFLP